MQIKKSNIYIEKENCFLRNIKEKDVYGNWWKWFNDPDVTAYMNKGQIKNTIQKQLEFYKKVAESKNDLVFAICNRKNGQHIGTIGLHDINLKKESAQFGIVIGEKNFWGKGIGSVAWRMMINYGFSDLRLTIIDTTIFAKNIASIKIAKKGGFQTIKLLKNDVEKNGKMYDRVYMVLNQNNWKKYYKI